MDIENLFATLEDDRLTASGKACVAIAKQVYTNGFRVADGQSESSSTEARAWVRLALEADKDELARRLKRLETRRAEKTQAREAANRMRDRKRAANGGNVVEFPSKDPI